MIREALESQLSFTHFTIHANLEGVTQAESLQSAPQGGNGANWVLGHIVDTRNIMHEFLGAEPALEEAGAAIYGRGTDPLGPDSGGMELELLLQRLDASQERLLEKLLSATDALLSGKVPGLFPPHEPTTRANLIATLLFHEAYHAGQLGVLRRILGKEAAIR
jgi:hypothetical protein